MPNVAAIEPLQNGMDAMNDWLLYVRAVGDAVYLVAAVTTPISTVIARHYRHRCSVGTQPTRPGGCRVSPNRRALVVVRSR